MKIRFYIDDSKSENRDHSNCLHRNAEVIEFEISNENKKRESIKFTKEMIRENSLKRPYSTYLLSSIESDYGDDIKYIQGVLEKIEFIEKEKISSYVAGGDNFTHTITSSSVKFEHSIFGECYEYPTWSCPLAHYKAALQGWRKFLDMPQVIGTELIIELPVVTQEHVSKSSKEMYVGQSHRSQSIFF